jgi:glycosyltransferase involved in cell wall biosynthesis
MRIVHTSLRYPPATGGVETYVRGIVEHTRDPAAGRDVRVLTSGLRTHGPPALLDPDLLLDDPMYVQRLHHAATPLVSYPRLQALRYYLGHHRPGILHGHGFWYQPADVSARYARRNHIPFVLHPYYYEHGVRHKALWQIYKKTIGYRTFAAADVVVVISPFEQKLIQQAGFPVKRFELIPPGVNLAKFKKPQPSPYQRRGINGVIILSVGRLAPSKGLDELISAVAEIAKNQPDVQLAVVGEDFGTKAKLQDQAQALGVGARVHFLGKLPAAELIGAYQHAALLAHPSHYEAFGIVLAESLAAGTPVVARNVAAIPTVVPHQEVGILFNNQTEFIDGIRLLITDSVKRRKFADRGKQHVNRHFAVEHSTKKITDLYDSLLRQLPT